MAISGISMLAGADASKVWASWGDELLDLARTSSLFDLELCAKPCIVMPAPSIDALEDTLAAGDPIRIMGRPNEWEGRVGAKGTGASDAIELAAQLAQGEDGALVSDELASGRVRCALDESQVRERLIELKRVDNNWLAERGAHVLYAAFGVLGWRREQDGPIRYAPIVLWPVDLVSRPGAAGLELIARPEGPRVNRALVEILRRDYGVSISGVDPLPRDSAGADLRLAFDAFKVRIATMGQGRLRDWSLLEVGVLAALPDALADLWCDVNVQARRAQTPSLGGGYGFGSSKPSRLSRSSKAEDLQRGAIDPGTAPAEAAPAGVVPAETVPTEAAPAAQTTPAETTAISSLPDPSQSPQAPHPLMPLLADADQRSIVVRVAAGESVVVRGASGTGRTQAAASVIAAQLGEGKRVLFVSSKASAADALMRRLASIGIDRYCLDLRPNHASVRDVCEQLERRIALQRSHVGRDRQTGGLAGSTSEGSTGEYLLTSESASDLAREVDAYRQGLYTRNAAGLTLREQICRFEQYRDAPDIVRIDGRGIDCINGEAGLEVRFKLAERMAAVVRRIGCPGSHPLRRICGTVFRPSVGDEVPGLLDNLQVKIDEMNAAADRLAQTTGLPAPVSDEDWANTQRIFDLLDEWRALPESWRALEDIPAFLKSLDYLLGEREQFERDNVTQYARWVPAFFDEIGAAALETDWQAARRQSVFGRHRAMQRLVDRLATYSITDFTEEQIPQAIATLRQHAAASRQLTTDVEAIAPMLATFGEPGKFDWKAIRKVCSFAMDLELRTTQTLAAMQVSEDVFIACRKTKLADAMSSKVLREALGSRRRYQQAHDAAVALIGEIECDQGETQVQADAALVQDARGHLSSLQDWMAWRSLVEEGHDLGLDPLADALDRGLAPQDALPAYKRGLYRAMCLASLDDNPTCARFSGAIFDEEITQLAKAYDKLRDLSGQELRTRLEQRVAHVLAWAHHDPQMATLRSAMVAADKTSNSTSDLRTFLTQISDILSVLCPCVLATPQTVARHLDVSADRYDVVIIDEASRLRSCEAAGSMVRAHTAVLLGDPNQLPPYGYGRNSFLAQTTDVTSSVVEDALAAGFGVGVTRIERRASHEGLVVSASAYGGFESSQTSVDGAADSADGADQGARRGSNMDFDPITLPSADDMRHAMTLQVVKPVAGTSNEAFREPTDTTDTTDTNVDIPELLISEARAVVGELRRRYNAERIQRRSDAHQSQNHNPAAGSNYDHHSIEVVLFDDRQRALVERLLEDAFHADTHLKAWAEQGEEPLLVRCAWDVQGDERDIALVSVGRSMGASASVSTAVTSRTPDRAARISLAPQSVADEGGWRLVVAAMSCSRRETVVFSSLSPSQVCPTNGATAGERALRDMLIAAQMGGAHFFSVGAPLPHDAIVQHLGAAIKEHSYEVSYGVGTSSALRVGIGVVDPQQPERFMAGIVFDDQGYATHHDPYDREVALVREFGRLGWRLMRVWAMEWWANPQAVIEHVLSWLDELSGHAESEEPSQSTKDKPQLEQPLAPLPVTDAAQVERLLALGGRQSFGDLRDATVGELDALWQDDADHSSDGQDMLAGLIDIDDLNDLEEPEASDEPGPATQPAVEPIAEPKDQPKEEFDAQAKSEHDVYEQQDSSQGDETAYKDNPPTTVSTVSEMTSNPAFLRDAAADTDTEMGEKMPDVTNL